MENGGRGCFWKACNTPLESVPSQPNKHYWNTAVKSDRLRTKADPLKWDEPDRAQFMHKTRTGATKNFLLGGVGLTLRINLVYVWLKKTMF
jgi:hypothetical protein